LALNATIAGGARGRSRARLRSGGSRDEGAGRADYARDGGDRREGGRAIRAATERTATAEVGRSITRIDEVPAAIAAAVVEQGATTREIAAAVPGVAQTGFSNPRIFRKCSKSMV
jgi:hypothetical protein